MSKHSVVLLAGIGMIAGCVGGAAKSSDHEGITQQQSPAAGTDTSPTSGSVCIDNGCPSTSTPPASDCAAGETPVYSYITAAPSTLAASGVSAGPGGASMTTSCEVTSCGAGQVGVDLPATQFAQRGGQASSQSQGGITCVTAPPSCPSGQYPAYVPSSAGDSVFAGAGYPGDGTTAPATDDGTWHCVGSCDVIVQYGVEYGGLAVCAPTPPSCTSPAMAGFDATTQTWSCVTTCDPSYDVDTYEQARVCIPC